MIGSLPTDSATFAACRREALAGDIAACKMLGACYADPAGEWQVYRKPTGAGGGKRGTPRKP